MNRALTGLATAALLVSVTGVATTAQAATSHCTDHRSEVKIEVPQGETGTSQVVTVDGEDITVVVDGDDVSFYYADGSTAYGVFCLKAGTGTTDGFGETGSTGSYYGPGKDISYVVLYGLGARS